MLVSPAEPASLRALGTVSVKTEELGCDFLYVTKMGLVGVQRKEYGDLLASTIGSDRLYRELQQMKALDQGIFLIEGRPQWTIDGDLIGRQQWTVAQHLGLMCSMQLQSYWVLHTANLAESSQLLSNLSKWLDKEAHNSLNNRPKPTSSWGVRTNTDWACHLLQSFPNIGPETAKNIYRHFGRVPLSWECSEEELRKVEGVGKVRAKKLMEALNG